MNHVHFEAVDIGGSKFRTRIGAALWLLMIKPPESVSHSRDRWIFLGIFAVLNQVEQKSERQPTMLF